MTVPVSFAARARTAVLAVLALVVGVLPFARAWADPPATTPVYSVSVTDVTATEGNTGQKNFTFSVSVSPVPLQAIDVDYTTQDASLPSSGTNFTATAGSDYLAKTGTLHFDVGTTTPKTVGVVVLGDTAPEPNERFELVASIEGGSASQRDTGVGTITNDDATPPSIRIADLSANEGNTGTTTFTFTVTRDGNTSQAVPFSWKTNDTTTGTNDAGSGTGGDYNPVPAATGTVNAGQTTTTVSVTVNGDTTVEGNETFTVDILQAANAAIGDASATATILDDDAPALNFDDTTVGDEPTPTLGADPGAESTATRTFKVVLATASGRTVTVDYATADGSATAPGDYTAKTGTLTFSPGETEKTFAVTVVDDSLNEGTEEFLVNLSDPTNAVLGNDHTAKGRIEDNDNTASALSVSNPSVNEPDTSTVNADFTVSLDKPSGVTVTADYAATNGTATVGNDFTATTGTLTFNPGDTSKTVTVPVKGDTLAEGNETFDLTLSNNTGAGLACTPSSTPPCGTATIVDNETVTVSAIDAAAAEGNPPAASNMTFTLTLSTAVAQPTNVDYHTADGSAKAGEDYTATTAGTATIPANQAGVDVTIPLKADTFAEPTESFTLVLDRSDVAAIGDGSATGEISDEDGTPPSVSIADVTHDEAGTFTFTVTCGTITNPAGGSVHYTVTPGTATAPDDLDVSSGTASCSAADSTDTVTVNVKDDSKDEVEEAFTVTLSDPSNLEIGDGQATGTITDNDGPDVSIDDVTVAEGNSGTTDMTFTVSVNAPSAEAFNVDYAIADDSTDSSDYTASDGTLTFPAGDDTPRKITVKVVGDTTDEADETLTVTLSLPDTTKAKLGDDEGTGTITDDDGPTLSINDPAAVAESPSGTDNKIEFTVTPSAPSPQAIDVDYTTTDGTATAADYVAETSTLTIPADAASAKIDVAIKADTKDEPDETFTVSLSNPHNATIADNQGTGTISDDDQPPTLAIGNQSVTEGDHSAVPATLQVTLSTASGKTITVNYATRNDTATAPADYSAKSGTLTFLPDETSKSVTVLVAGDVTPEPTETFYVDLSTPTNATIADSEGKVTIVDNDMAQDAGQGYWLTGSDAGVFSFGNAEFHGSKGGERINQPIVGMAATPSGDGYWQVASDGGIFSFGDAVFYGSKGGEVLNQPVVGMAATPSGHGYWLVAKDGGIFTFGDAPFLGSKGGEHLNQPVVGMAATPSGHGYWLVASDGGIFSFGDAVYFGSKGGSPVAAPVTGMAATPTGGGYWMVAKDGGIFTFGDAMFYGSAVGFASTAPIVGVAATPSGKGYWLTSTDGKVFAKGDARALGSMAGKPLNGPIVGIAAWPG